MKVLVPMFSGENETFTEEAAQSLIGQTTNFYGADGQKFDATIVAAELEGLGGETIILTLELPDRAGISPTL
jgi:hypothetical protein